jgi:GDP-L-fucose synthase
MNRDSKIFIAGGHAGMVGTAIVRSLKMKKFTNLLTPSRADLNLLDTFQVSEYFKKHKPDFVFLAAAKVGGIMANKTQKADFIYDNLQIQNNVIYSSWKYHVKKLLFLGSSCIYPRNARQPIKEDELLSGKLEDTNDAYAVAKIAGIKMCQSFNEQYGANFISVMPTNLYGINDNFDLNSSHVLPALIRKFDEARSRDLPKVTLWGTGNPRREFLHVDDLAEACVFLMLNYDSSEIINIGYGKDITIKELAEIIKKSVGYKGTINWDTSMPDGTPQKLLDISKITSLGWKPTISIDKGIRDTYDWYKQHKTNK